MTFSHLIKVMILIFFFLSAVKGNADCPRLLVASVELPGVRGSRDFTLDIGEDRLVLEARKANYLLDLFLPYSIRQEGVEASFHLPTATLHIRLPLID